MRWQWARAALGFLLAAVLLFTGIVLPGCGGGGGSDPSPPAAPSNVTATPGDNTVTVSWDNVAGAASYNIYYGTSAGVTKANGTKLSSATSPRAVAGLANGTTYYFVVTAVNADGESAVSAEISATPAAAPPPAAPTGVTATAGNGQVTVSWSAVAGATSYNIYYASSPGVTTASPTKVVGATSGDPVTGLTNGTTYYFVVTAFNANGESAVSSPEMSAIPGTPPAAPTGVIASAGNGQVTVSWNPAAGAASYNIYHGTAAGVTIATGTKVAGAVSPSIVTGLTNGTPYFFVVTAVNGYGESTESSEVSATPGAPPATPTGVTATRGYGQVTVSWNPAAGAASYNIYYGTAAGVTIATGTKVAGAVSPSIVTGLTDGTTYYFVVTAVNGYGESAESLEVSAIPGFAQADITGTWDIIQFANGSGARWVHAIGTFNASGNLTLTNFLDSDGNSAGPTTLQWTIDPSGVVSQLDSGSDTGFHGKMSSDKKLITGVQTLDNTTSPYTMEMLIARKRTGTVFDNTDLVNIPFVLHDLHGGAASDNVWNYAPGSTNASRQLTLDNVTTPAGTGGGNVNFDTISVSSEGIATLANLPSYYGLMTDDKKVIFAIFGAIGSFNYGLQVFTITGQTFAQADLAGTYNFHTLRNALPNPLWAYGTFSADATGNGTYLLYADSGGGLTPADFVRVLATNGLITDPADATYHGQMSYNKDLFVQTSTTSGGYELAISFR